MATRLNPFAFGFAIGITEGLYMMLFAWAAWLFGYATPFIQMISQALYGYSPTFIGGIIGGIEGFFDGFIFGLIASWIYNFFLNAFSQSAR